MDFVAKFSVAVVKRIIPAQLLGYTVDFPLSFEFLSVLETGTLNVLPIVKQY